MTLEVLLILALSLAGGGTLGVMVFLRLRREARDTEALERAEAEGRAQPPTLHPVIDPDKCIGSLSCLSVCPEGDILGKVDGKAALIDPAACIGHGKCALECPVDAISLVMGTATRGVDLPELSESFETSRPGVHIVGELGGMGLIKNAFTQGVQLSEHLAQALTPGGDGGVSDVVVVGAGPAGLATALGLRQAGLTFRVVEQESVGGTIAHYPRQKLVMTEQVTLPLYGKFGKTELSKEELLEEFQRALAKGDIDVDVGTKVQRIDGEDGAFTVHTSKGPLAARKVVLAVGRRGTPRKLGVPGEELGKVTYRLVDASQYRGAKVLVVGGGDAALEAAVQIAEETNAEVTLSYRNAEFGRAREANKRRFAALLAKGRVRALMSSTVLEVLPDRVKLSWEGKKVAAPNDFVIACLGGELPNEFLAQNGVGMRRLHGEALQGPVKGAAAKGPSKAEKEERRRRAFAMGLFVLGALIVAALAKVGQDYYHLPVKLRPEHPAHAFLKPSGPWGHGVGIVATLFMLSNFLYSVRKRWGRLKGLSSIRTWLTFHQFVGFMSPLVIAFHAAFQSNNTLATLTAAALAVVVLTGIVGRFLFGLVPSGSAEQGELEALQRQLETLKRRATAELEEVGTGELEVDDVVSVVTEVPVEWTLGDLLVRRPLMRLREWRRVRRQRARFASRSGFRAFRSDARQLRLLSIQVRFYRALKQAMRVWRVFHVVLAVCLVVLIAGHIGVSLFLGYRWLFS